MVLEISGKILGQEDVRETPASDVNAFSFDTDDFTNTAGAISLKNKTSYWSATGTAFRGIAPDVDNVEYPSAGIVTVSAGTIIFQAQVHLPQGAVVIGAIVYGSDSNDTWTLNVRTTITQATTAQLASGVFNTEDTSIDNATIDNSTYSYWFRAGIVAATDQIYGARITYTTDYI